MENFKGTKGEVKKVSHYNKQFSQESFLICTGTKDAFAEVYTGCGKPDNSKLFKEAEADADLIVDAFNIANTHDLLPSQLLEQRNELLEVVKKMKMLELIIKPVNVKPEHEHEARAINSLYNMIDEVIDKALK